MIAAYLKVWEQEPAHTAGNKNETGAKQTSVKTLRIPPSPPRPRPRTGQETPNGRIVQVTIPPSRGQQAAPPSASLSHFVLETRLKHPTGGVGGDSITSGLSGMGPSVPGTRGGDSRCGGRQVWPLEPGVSNNRRRKHCTTFARVR